jgi:hypothetical protein
MPMFTKGDTVRLNAYAISLGLYRTKPRARRGIVTSCQPDRHGEECATVQWEDNEVVIRGISVAFLELVAEDQALSLTNTGGR